MNDVGLQKRESALGWRSFWGNNLLEHMIPFLNDENNVIRIKEITFVHDLVPCMKANTTQQLLE